MNKGFIYAFVFFVVGILLAGGFVLYSSYSEKERLSDEVSETLFEIAELKANKINNYLSGLEGDIEILQDSDEVRELLKWELVFDETALKEDVSERARVIAKEVENYIRFHPDMTLEDLQESSEFQGIAVQPVGKDGYSAIFEVESLISYFHKDPNIVDFDLNNLKGSNPEFFEIISRIRDGEERVDDFYDWKESSGEVRKKYGSYRRIPVKTADGKSLTVGITAYFDDYKTINIKSEFLEKFNKEKDYHDIVLISPDGYVSYMIDEHWVFGTSLEWEVNLDKGLSVNYFDVRDSKEVLFYGPFLEEYGHIYPMVSVMAPVYEGKELLGYVAIADYTDDIFDITEEIISDYETEETYLVNEEQLLISPLRLGDFDIMVQSVYTENVKECVEDLEEKGEAAFEEELEEEEDDIRIALDYRGNIIIGTDYPLPKLNWCLLSEIDKEEVLLPLEDFVKNRIYFSIGGVLVLSLIGFFVGGYFDRNFMRKRRKVKQKKSKDWLDIKFLKNLKLRYIFLFVLIFLVGYFFLVTSFFQGWQNAKFFDDIPDMLIFVVAFIIFISAFRLKNLKAKKYAIMGAGLICLQRLIEVPLQEYQQIVGIIDPLYWTPSITCGVFGVIALFLGYRRIIK